MEANRMQEFAQILRDLASGVKEPESITAGICYEISVFCNEISVFCYAKSDEYNDLIGLFFDHNENWDKWTGSYAFPIPHPTKDPGYGFGEVDMWTGEYGDTRRELCILFAEYLENKAKELA